MINLQSLVIALNLVLVALSCTSCASMTARSEPRTEKFYPGVKNDLYYLQNPDAQGYGSLTWLNAVDLPFSFLLDTLLLPIDVFHSVPDKQGDPGE